MTAATTEGGWPEKLSDWLRRYGLAECVGLACAFGGSWTSRRLSGSSIAAGYAAAWGESLGYSAVIVLKEYLIAKRASHAAGRSLAAHDVGRAATGLITEFGPAAMLDTLLVRPLTMGAGMRIIGPRGGLLAGKLAADVLFYVPVIFMYERRKRVARQRNAQP